MIARTGGTIGKSYIVEELGEAAVFASYHIRVQPSENINENYLKLYLESLLYWKQLVDCSMGTGQLIFNGQSLKALWASCPPLAEEASLQKWKNFW